MAHRDREAGVSDRARRQNIVAAPGLQGALASVTRAKTGIMKVAMAMIAVVPSRAQKGAEHHRREDRRQSEDDVADAHQQALEDTAKCRCRNACDRAERSADGDGGDAIDSEFQQPTISIESTSRPN
jgi:hypothetical protein